MESSVIQILKKNNITLYKFIKTMGIDPIKSQSNWKKKLAGITSVREEELKMVARALKQLTGVSGVKNIKENVEKIYII